MFEKVKIKSLKYKTSELPSEAINKYSLPALTAGIQNQGLNNYVPKDNATILKNVISISANGANTGATFYQNKEFTVLQDAYAIKWNLTSNSLTDNQYIFFCSAISKTIFGNFEWTNKAGWEKIKVETIQLPTKNGEIDFKFMESIIIELETERISKLEAYLEASGLKDYTLTVEEEQVLHDFDSDKIELKEFQIDTLFDVSPSKAYKMNDANILTENGKTPYVSNQSQNNGYIGWSNLPPLNPSNVITLSDTWQSERTIFYQPTKFIGKSHLQVMKAFDKRLKKFELFFVISSFRKAITELNYDYGTKFNRTKINATKIQLPTKNNQLDYELMDTLISAIQKLVIKDVVLYTNKKSSNLKV
ncbi:MAG TPA: restriction endonuclease [Sulfurovum sp.]|nr:restriction endonuclease [Sulfurovum sp.]